MNPAIIAALDAFVAEIQRPMFEQLAKLEEQLKTITIASDDQIVKVMQESSIIDDKVEAALKSSNEVMDYNDVENLISEKIGEIDYDEYVSEALNNVDWSDVIDTGVIRAVIRDMTFRVEVD